MERGGRKLAGPCGPQVDLYTSWETTPPLPADSSENGLILKLITFILTSNRNTSEGGKQWKRVSKFCFVFFTFLPFYDSYYWSETSGCESQPLKMSRRGLIKSSYWQVQAEWGYVSSCLSLVNVSHGIFFSFCCAKVQDGTGWLSRVSVNGRAGDQQHGDK